MISSADRDTLCPWCILPFGYAHTLFLVFAEEPERIEIHGVEAIELRKGLNQVNQVVGHPTLAAELFKLRGKRPISRKYAYEINGVALFDVYAQLCVGGTWVCAFHLEKAIEMHAHGRRLT
jgi:hypothetical protein